MRLLMEDGFALLLETGDHLLLDAVQSATGKCAGLAFGGGAIV